MASSTLLFHNANSLHLLRDGHQAHQRNLADSRIRLHNLLLGRLLTRLLDHRHRCLHVKRRLLRLVRLDQWLLRLTPEPGRMCLRPLLLHDRCAHRTSISLDLHLDCTHGDHHGAHDDDFAIKHAINWTCARFAWGIVAYDTQRTVWTILQSHEVQSSTS